MEKEITIPKGYEAKIEGDKVVFVKKESEDEKIRKAIFKALSRKEIRNVILTENIKISDALDWLERQKERKSAWREEDEAKLNRICSILVKTLFVGNKELFELQDWLKSLPERFK